MELPGVPSAVLEALKGAALDAGMPRLALVGGVVRDLLLHRHHGRPWVGVPDLDWVVEGQAARLASVLQDRCGLQRVTAVQEHGAFGTVALQLDGQLRRRRVAGRRRDYRGNNCRIWRTVGSGAGSGQVEIRHLSHRESPRLSRQHVR